MEEKKEEPLKLREKLNLDKTVKLEFNKGAFIIINFPEKRKAKEFMPIQSQIQRGVRGDFSLPELSSLRDVLRFTYKEVHARITDELEHRMRKMYESIKVSELDERSGNNNK